MGKTSLTARAEAGNDIQISGATLPDSIQWMPPGRQSVVPLVNGQPRRVTFNVTQALAENFNRQLQEMRAAAKRGEGDEPYLDFNHEDGERSAEVTELYWAGDDPKTGGIRAKVIWSAAGSAAVLGRNFRRFSPEWDLDQQTLQPLYIHENLGGLVNRAAFKNIASVIATGAHAQGIRGRINDIMAQAREASASGKITFDRALSNLLSSDPETYREYMNSMTGNSMSVGKNSSAVASAAANELYDQCVQEAQEYADQYRIPLQQAIQRLMQTNNQWYARYRQALLNTKPGKK